jgi:transposase
MCQTVGGHKTQTAHVNRRVHIDCKRIGIDIAKNVFQIHGVNPRDEVVIKKRLKLDQMLAYFTTLPACDIAMEACGTSHYWSRTLTSLGHHVKLIAPQHVKPYVQRGKNDANDAAAICEAASRPHMKFVSTKNETAQAMQLVHRARSLTMRNRVALLNEIRSTLAEFGVVCKTLGAACTRSTLMATIHDAGQLFPAPLPELLQLLADRLDGLDAELKRLDVMLEAHVQSSEVVQRLMAIGGIGPITASAMACSIPDMSAFKSSRDFAAWLGLTPRQHSSGGKDKLGGITKGGDGYLRMLLIQGAKSVVRYCVNKTDALSVWLHSLLLRRHPNVVAVALANKTARVIWAMLSKGETYRIPCEIAVEV